MHAEFCSFFLPSDSLCDVLATLSRKACFPGGEEGRGGLLIYCAEASKIVPSKLIIRLDQTGDFNFQCSLCGILFKRRKQAQEHSYKHSDKFPYECLFCNYGTVRSYNLKRHCERLHSTSKVNQKPELRKSDSEQTAPDSNEPNSKQSCVAQVTTLSNLQGQPVITTAKLIRTGADDLKAEELKGDIQTESSTASRIETESTIPGTRLRTYQNLHSAARGGSLPTSKTSLNDTSIHRGNAGEEDPGDDSDCLMIEESVSDVEDMQ